MQRLRWVACTVYVTGQTIAKTQDTGSVLSQVSSWLSRAATAEPPASVTRQIEQVVQG